MSYENLTKQLMPILVESILEASNVKFTAAGVMSVDGERVTMKEISTWFINYCRNDEGRKAYLPLLTDAPSPSFLLESLKTNIRIGQSKHRTSVYKGADDVVRGFSYDGMIPFISVENAKKILFFSKNRKEITSLDYETYAACTDKEYRIRPMPAVIEFNPYRPEQIYMGDYDGQACTHLNTYRKPEWQIGKRLSDDEAQTYSKLSPIIDDFFTHLFPTPECKEFVYDWLHYALSSRCETYLVMNGAKGVGKNVLSNIICASLVGKANHKIAHRGALEKFNVILAECRMIVFDEFKIVDDEAINTLKRFANADQMIERKSIDVGKTEKTYNSYIICNNAVTDMKIEWDDRRFSVTDLSEKKLEDVWSAEKIKLLVAICEDPNSEEMRNFGYWLLYRKTSVMASEFTMYKGNHFYKLCYTSFPEWAKMIIDEITNNPQPYYEESDLRMMLKERTNGQSRLPNKARVEDFLKNYKHLGENYLGVLEADERTYYLQVNEHFVKTSKDTTGITFESVDLL